MNRLSARFYTVLILSITVFSPWSLRATGLYSDFPSFFPVVDTSRVLLTVRQVQIQLDPDLATILQAEVDLRIWNRSQVRFGVFYPVIAYPSGIANAVGDGFIRANVRILGDTLNIDGLYARGEVRVPMGPKRQLPFSYSTLDGGLGLEFRRRFPLIGIRTACTYTLVGEKLEIDEFTYDNFLIAGGAVYFDLLQGTTFEFSGFYKVFRGGDAREVYLVTIRQRLSDRLDLVIDGALDSGSDEERVFDSLFAIAIYYRFPPKKTAASGK